MKAFENFQANGIDGVVLHAQQALIDVINQVTAIKHGPVSQKGFVLLCNDLEHIKQQIFQEDVQNFTVAQKKVFLKETVEKCPEGVFSEEEKKECLENLETFSDQDLQKKIEILQDKIEEFFNSTILNISKRHAEVVGDKVAEAFSQLEAQLEVKLQGKQVSLFEDNEQKKQFMEEQTKGFAETLDLINSLQAGIGAKAVFGEFVNKLLNKNVGLNSISVDANTQAKDLRENCEVQFREKLSTILATKVNQMQQEQKIAQESFSTTETEPRTEITNEELEERQKGIFELFKRELEKARQQEQVRKKSEEEARIVEANKSFEQFFNAANRSTDEAQVTKLKRLFQNEVTKFLEENSSSSELCQCIKNKHTELLKKFGIAENEEFNTKVGAYSFSGQIEMKYKVYQENSARKAIEVLEKVEFVAKLPEMTQQSTDISMFVRRIANDTTHAIRAILEPLKQTATLGSSRFF